MNSGVWGKIPKYQPTTKCED